MSLLGLCHEDIADSSLLFLESLTLVKACCRLVRKVKHSYRGPHGKLLRHPTKSHISHLGKASSSPAKPSKASSLVNILDVTF